MKTLYLIGGTMGVGKTAVCQELKKVLPEAVFLDGDWCWDADPFQVTDETKAMVMENIAFLLNQFLHCNAYKNVIFCWVMHQQPIIDAILSALDLNGVKVETISLLGNAETVRSRLQKDVDEGKRTADVIDRSLPRIPLYQALNTAKVMTDGKSIAEIANEIIAL